MEIWICPVLGTTFYFYSFERLQELDDRNMRNVIREDQEHR